MCVCVCVCVCVRVHAHVRAWMCGAGENASTHTVKKTCAFFALDDDRIY